MKYLLVLSCVLVTASAQRPPYAGSSPKGVPELASRFRDTSADSSSASPVSASGSGIANRVGGDDGTTVRIPVDARGDVNLVNRVSQWPRENQPFWFINADHIERHRNPNGQAVNNNNLQRTQSGDFIQSGTDTDYFDLSQPLPTRRNQQFQSRNSINFDDTRAAKPSRPIYYAFFKRR